MTSPYQTFKKGDALFGQASPMVSMILLALLQHLAVVSSNGILGNEPLTYGLRRPHQSYYQSLLISRGFGFGG